MKKILVSSLVLGFASLAVAAPEVGQPAPGFTLMDSHGKEHRLADFQGKTVVLEWVNYGCPFVKKHYDSKNMQTLQKAAAEKGVVWLAICSSAPGKQGNETPESGKAKTAEYGSAATAYLVDADGRGGKLYEARTTPEMFVINPEGTLIYQGAIDDNNSPDSAVIPDSKNFVKAALDDTLAGKPVSIPSTKSYGCSVKY